VANSPCLRSSSSRPCFSLDELLKPGPCSTRPFPVYPDHLGNCGKFHGV
jgi:hypothetical protein